MKTLTLNVTKHSALTVVSLTLFGGMLQAQSDDYPRAASGATIEEVFVTARKREESLQETPLSVTAFSGQALEGAGINNFTDLQNHVPSLDISSAFKGGLITIRSVAPTGGEGLGLNSPQVSM